MTREESGPVRAEEHAIVDDDSVSVAHPEARRHDDDAFDAMIAPRAITDLRLKLTAPKSLNLRSPSRSFHGTVGAAAATRAITA